LAPSFSSSSDCLSIVYSVRYTTAAAGPERVERVEGFLRTITGLTDMDEREYKVVVELDTNVYSFKIMSAGDLGKRV
jgi:hypothetical protein